MESASDEKTHIEDEFRVVQASLKAKAYNPEKIEQIEATMLVMAKSDNIESLPVVNRWKTHIQDAFVVEIEGIKASLKAYIKAYNATKMEQTAAARLVMLKRDDIDSLQVVNRWKMYIFFKQIFNMEHKIQHGALLSDDEKLFLFLAKQIRLDDGQSAKHIYMFLHMETLREELNSLEHKTLKADAVVKGMRFPYSSSNFKPPPVPPRIWPLPPEPVSEMLLSQPSANGNHNTYGQPPSRESVRQMIISQPSWHRNHNSYGPLLTLEAMWQMVLAPTSVYGDNNIYALPLTIGALRTMLPTPTNSYSDHIIYASLLTSRAVMRMVPTPTCVSSDHNIYAPPQTVGVVMPMVRTPAPDHRHNNYAPPPTIGSVRPMVSTPAPVYNDHNIYAPPPTIGTMRPMVCTPSPVYGDHNICALPPTAGVMRPMVPSPAPVYDDNNIYVPPPTAGALRPMVPSPTPVYGDDNIYAAPPNAGAAWPAGPTPTSI